MIILFNIIVMHNCQCISFCWIFYPVYLWRILIFNHSNIDIRIHCFFTSARIFPPFFRFTHKNDEQNFSLPKIMSRLVERFVTRVEDKFDRRWQSRFRGEKNWHPLRGESFLSLPSRLNTMKHVLVSRDRLFSTDTSNLLSWNIPDALCKIFLEDFFK